MGGGHFDALEMLLRLRTTPNPATAPPPSTTHCVEPGRDALSRIPIDPLPAHIATSCCECCSGFTDLKS